MTSRRGFLKLLSAAIATPVIAKLSMDSGLILPPSVQEVAVIEPVIVQSGAASFARANRIYCMPGMVDMLSQHIRDNAMASLPGGTHFQVRAVPMTGADYGRVQQRYKPSGGVALVWVSESDVTPQDTEYELVGRFMVPKREVITPPPEPMIVTTVEPERYELVGHNVAGQPIFQEKGTTRRGLFDWLTGSKA